MKSTEFFVYLLVSSDNATYVGATVDLDHRLRQHNKEIKGGAHATSVRVNKGETWTRACHVRGMPDWKSALQVEWRWKQLSRNRVEKSPLVRRMRALEELLMLERATSKAVAYAEWPNMPEVICETEEARLLYPPLKKVEPNHPPLGEPIRGAK